MDNHDLKSIFINPHETKFKIDMIKIVYIYMISIYFSPKYFLTFL